MLLSGYAMIAMSAPPEQYGGADLGLPGDVVVFAGQFYGHDAGLQGQPQRGEPASQHLPHLHTVIHCKSNRLDISLFRQLMHAVAGLADLINGYTYAFYHG